LLGSTPYYARDEAYYTSLVQQAERFAIVEDLATIRRDRTFARSQIYRSEISQAYASLQQIFSIISSIYIEDLGVT